MSRLRYGSPTCYSANPTAFFTLRTGVSQLSLKSGCYAEARYALIANMTD